MVSGAWQIGQTGPELADVWGLAEATVRGDATDASAQIHEAAPDLAEEVRVMALALVARARALAELEPDAGRRARLFLDVATTAVRVAGPVRREAPAESTLPPQPPQPAALAPWLEYEAEADAQ